MLQMIHLSFHLSGIQVTHKNDDLAKTTKWADNLEMLLKPDTTKQT